VVLVCDQAQTTCYEASIEQAGAAFDVSMLDSATMAGAFAAGFVVVGMTWAIGWGFRTILNMIGR
jgi:hypothetical protein